MGKHWEKMSPTMYRANLEIRATITERMFSRRGEHLFARPEEWVMRAWNMNIC